MGCAPSAIGEESVSRCKQRKLLIKQVIAARSAFSAAHNAYAAALLSTGCVFRKYAHGEVTAAEISTLKRTVLISKDDAVLKESVKAKQKRGVSNTALNDGVSIKSHTKQAKPHWDYFSVHLPEVRITGDNEDDEALEFHTPDNLSRTEFSDDDDEVENPLQKQFMQSETASEEFRRAINANWWKGLEEISDEFLNTSDCALQVSRLLDPNRYRLHRKAADNRETIDHARRVMSLITWNPPADVISTNDELYAKENESLPLVLYKLLEWEKKLYDNVKAGELMKLEYQRKLVLLATQKRSGARIELLVKTKADVRHLRTSYMVELQLIDLNVSELNNLRDRQLYPKLVELVEGMAKMWENMYLHHNKQLRIITDLKVLEITAIPRETTLDQYEKTTKLLSMVKGWRTQFNKNTTHQNSFITILNIWLKLNLIPIRKNLKEKLSSSSSSSSKRIPIPPIQLLLHSWHEYIAKLPHEHVNAAMSSFGATLETIVILQEEEIKMKNKCEETRREFLRKSNAFEEWLKEHNKCGVGKDSVSEKCIVIEFLKRRLEEEMKEHRKLCVRVRAKSVRCLRTRLPEVLRAISDYANACSVVYNRLMCIVALSKNSTNVDGEPDS
ncbi:hypothetical protein V2J09_003095 [Rumex salicifolius]